MELHLECTAYTPYDGMSIGIEEDEECVMLCDVDWSIKLWVYICTPSCAPSVTGST